MKFENTDIWGFEHAIRGMRNPKNSWNLSDTKTGFNVDTGLYFWNIGPKDMKLMQNLIKAGPEHRKFMRQIFVSVDITAPLYWWKEFDTYKVGTVANSTSTMHKLTSAPITRECFEMDDYDGDLPVQKVDQSSVTEEEKACHFIAFWHVDDGWDHIIEWLEDLRQEILRMEDPKNQKLYWKELVRMLPEAWL